MTTAIAQSTPFVHVRKLATRDAWTVWYISGSARNRVGGDRSEEAAIRFGEAYAHLLGLHCEVDS